MKYLLRTLLVLIFICTCGTAIKDVLAMPHTTPKTPQDSHQLNKLKGLIKNEELESATCLQQAIEAQQKGQDAMALSLLKKTHPQSVLRDYIHYYTALSLAHQKKYTEALVTLSQGTKSIRQIDKEILTLKNKIQKHAQENSAWTEHQPDFLVLESSVAPFENPEQNAFFLFKSRDYENAIVAFKQILEKDQHTANKAEILVKLAQANARLDRTEEAIKIYEQLRSEFPASPLAAQANYKIGFLYFDSKQYQKTINHFEQFLNGNRRHEKEGALYYRGFSYYLMGQYQKAIDEMERYLALSLTSEKQQMTNYWKARAEEKLRQKSLARDAYLALEQQNPLGYYGLLSKQRRLKQKLNVTTLVDLSAVPKWTSDNADRLLHKDISKLTNTDPLLRSILLYHINLDAFAFDESLLSPQFRTSQPALRMLAGNFTGLNFPLAYKKYVETNAKSFKISPNLVYAIMKQESAFKPQAISSAEAYGLMQIIPPTAYEIAQGLVLQDKNLKDLSDPKTNILFGSYYLKRLQEKFGENLILTMAAYNAGPEVVSRWQKKNRDIEDDLFIELIPYSQTREYVKKTLSNYLVYETMK